jgi:hypothetical protein
LTATQVSRFLALFHGSDYAHYIRRKSGTPFPIYRALSIEDVSQHLDGRTPSRLIVPVNTRGVSFCACIDIDAHSPDDPPLDHAAIAWRVTQLSLPLVVCKSTHGKGAWLWCFISEAEGCTTAILRAQLRRYAHALGVTAEIYPKQDILRDGHAGTCIGIPYFGKDRIAYGHLGQALTLGEFLDFAESQRISATRFEVASMASHLPPDEYNPISVWQARETFDVKLAVAARATKGDRHYSMGKLTIYAARCYLAGVFAFFGESEAEIKAKIWQASVSRFTETELRTRGLQGKLAALWRYGLNTGKKELSVYPNEIATLGTIDEEGFWQAFFGNVDNFPSAIDAKNYLEERLASAGISDTERVLRASGIGDAIAEEIMRDLRDKEIKVEIEELLEGRVS